MTLPQRHSIGQHFIGRVAMPIKLLRLSFMRRNDGCFAVTVPASSRQYTCPPLAGSRSRGSSQLRAALIVRPLAFAPTGICRTREASQAGFVRDASSSVAKVGLRQIAAVLSDSLGHTAAGLHLSQAPVNRIAGGWSAPDSVSCSPKLLNGSGCALTVAG
ncbi:MAG: hypothetical protein IPL70_13225 [Uliginosibacterium sp.]|nr:hypothetical protein [Uliginosibacterium sp.]